MLPVTLTGFGVTVRPLGAPDVATATNPVKFVRVRVTVDAPVAVAPACTVTAAGESAIVKLDAAAVVLNVAVTLCAALSVTAHVPVAFVHAPLQPANVLPVAGVAVSVTTVPDA